MSNNNFEKNDFKNLENSSLRETYEKSRDALDSYGVGITDVMKKIKSQYNLWKYWLISDGYDLKVYNFIENIQRKNGLPENGVIDMEVLSILNRDNPLLFDANQRVSINNYEKSKNNNFADKEKIYGVTAFEVAQHEANLIANEVKYPKNEALKKAKEHLRLRGTAAEIQKQILSIQEIYNLKKDWKINNEILELINTREYFLQENPKILDKKEMNKSYQEKVLSTLEKYPVNTELNISILAFLNEVLKPKLEQNSDFEKKYGKFYKTLWEKVWNYQKSENWKKDLVKLEQNQQTIYEIIKDDSISTGEKIKKLASDPMVLWIAGIAFLFWAFGDDTKLTDTWWKRLGVLFLWPVVFQAVWWDKAFDDLVNSFWKNFDKVVDSKEWEKARYKAEKTTKKFIENIPEKAPNWIKDIVWKWKEIWEKVVWEINTTLATISEKNEALKNSKDKAEKEKYVENFDLFAKELINDDLFLGQEISKIESVKSDSNKLKSFLSETTKTKLFPDNLTKIELQKRNKDLVNYVNLLLSSKNSQNVFLWDILVSNQKNKLNEIVNISEGYKYFNDEELNNEVKTLVWNLSEEKKSSVSYTLSTFLNENTWEKKNKLDELLKWNLSDSDKEIILKLKSIYLAKVIFDNYVKNISSIDLNGWQKSEDLLKQKQTETKQKISEIILDSKLKEIFENKIDEKTFDKKQEIMEKNLDWLDEEKLEFVRDYKKFTKALPVINDLPKDLTIENYKKYLTNEKMLAFSDVLTISEKYSKLTPETQDEEKMLKNIFKKWDEIQKLYEEIDKNLSILIDREIKEINRLAKEIAENKNSANFELRFPEYSKNLKDIFDRVYPNSKPGDFSDINKIIAYLFEKNRVSIFWEFSKKMSIVKQNYQIWENDKEQELMEGLVLLEKNLETKQKLSEIFSSYLKFYEKVPNYLKSELPNRREIWDMTFDGFKEVLGVFVNKLNKSENIDISVFDKEYKDLQSKIENYLK